MQLYLLLEQNIFLKYRLHFTHSTWVKILDLMGFFSLINSRCLNSYHIASRPISRKFLWSMGMASRGRSLPFLQLSNTYLKNWPNPAEKICIHSTNTVSGLTPPGDTILANTDCSFAPPPFPTLRMIIILFFWDSFIFFSLSSIFGVGTCHGTVELKSLEVEE